MEIAVRAFIVPKFADEEENSGFHGKSPAPDYTRVLLLDTETTTDRFQNLKFGHCKIFQHDNLHYQCIFYNPDFVITQERQILADYCKEKGIRLYNVRNFVDNVFLPEVFDLGTLCVGFNLPFDLSGLAISFGYARGNMRGGFSFVLNNNKRYPRLLIKRLDSTKSFIRFGNAVDSNKRRLGFKGYFLDLRTLAFALTGEKHTLESLCEAFDQPIKKIKVSQHGKITKDYIDYNVRDVDVTWALLKRLKGEYDIFGLIELPMTRVFSSASIGKACLRVTRIKPFIEKNGTIPKELLGNIMTAYFGGRSEVKIRKKPVRITLLDFTSMYPTMCILMKLWDFIICDHYEWEECTDDIQRFIDTITIEDLQKRETWEKMSTIVSLTPSNDILPIRAHYGDRNTWNIGVNTVSSDTRLFYALPDIIADKLLTGKSPRITRAIRFKPVGKQEGLKPITIFGERIDPGKENFFKLIIEHRKEIQEEQKRCTDDAHKAQLESKQRGLKTIANATSYGIFMEVNTVDEPLDVTVYGLSTFDCHASKREEFGDFYNPLIAALITSGARLVLAIVEAILAKHGAVHAFCDTDSMAIPPEFKDEIQRFFNPLNPYGIPVEMFKVVDGDNGGPLENVWCYCLSSKRYVLYKKDGKDIAILKASSHGLKHLMSPFNNGVETKWHEQVWRDVLNYHYGKMSYDDINEKYGSAFAVSELDISTPTIMNRFSRLNKGKSYEQQIKPFNFCLVGIGGWKDTDTGKVVKPLAPYRKDAQQCAYDDFIDYNSGKQLGGSQYWKKFADVLWDYIHHPEAKFDGNVGVLARKHITVSSVVHIGKESNNLDDSEILGVDENRLRRKHPRQDKSYLVQ